MNWSAYGLTSTFWLLALLMALADILARRGFWMAGLAVLAVANWLLPSPAEPISQAWGWISGTLLLACFAVNGYAVVVAARAVARTASAPERGLVAAPSR